MIIKHKTFEQMKCFRSANVMKNTIIINTFNSDNTNIPMIKARHLQIMTTTANEILTFEPRINIPIVANFAFFTFITFGNINFFT